MSTENPAGDPYSGEEVLSDSDSDSYSDASSGAPAGDYLPISAAENGSVSESDDDGDCAVLTRLHSNGSLDPAAAICALSIRGSQNGGTRSEDEDEEECEREAEIRRAFVEDERRRSARLTAENAARVMEAMRGVSFAGVAPAWAGEVPEELWASRLRRLREFRQ